MAGSWPGLAGNDRLWPGVAGYGWVLAGSGRLWPGLGRDMARLRTLYLKAYKYKIYGPKATDEILDSIMERLSHNSGKWQRPMIKSYGLSKHWYQSKLLGRPPRRIVQTEFIQRKNKREKEERFGKCMREITRDCREMLRKKQEEIEAYNASKTKGSSNKNFMFNHHSRKPTMDAKKRQRTQEKKKSDNNRHLSRRTNHQTREEEGPSLKETNS
ncbi:hypothetical protein Tco_0522097 [Tanacetum coccineum]